MGKKFGDKERKKEEKEKRNSFCLAGDGSLEILDAQASLKSEKRRKWSYSLDGSILLTLWVFVCQITFRLCITSQSQRVLPTTSALCLCQINKHTLSFVSLPKNNLRRINCTVMKVKYCPHLPQTLTVAAHRQPSCLQLFLCPSFGGSFLSSSRSDSSCFALHVVLALCLIYLCFWLFFFLSLLRSEDMSKSDYNQSWLYSTSAGYTCFSC